LGQFKLPVTITPASNTIFFIDPTNGDDNFLGTAARPWKSVANVLKSSELTGSRVATVASAGNDVVVTILGGVNVTQNAGGDISTPALLAGSVTVLKAPSAGTFTLNMGGNQLTLNKGYKLQDIKIKINPSVAGSIAVKITDPTAGLASVEVECKAGANNVTCVEVTGAGFHTLRDVRVDVGANNNTGTTGIKNDANATLSIVGGRVQPSDDTQPITLIDAQGVLTVTGLTVDMTNAGHQKASTGIVLNAAGSLVTNSTIKVNNGPSGSNAIGINVQAVSTVKNTTFFGYGNSIGIVGGNNLSSDSGNNAFSGNFAGGTVQP
jgi:hypothetical protein